MENTLTEIAVVLDRSGSMESARTDTIGGFNTFLAEQVDDAGDVNVTLAQFDNEYDVVYLREPIRQAPRLTADSYVPRGTTALLDAIGRTIDELGARLAAMPAAERPGCRWASTRASRCHALTARWRPGRSTSRWRDT